MDTDLRDDLISTALDGERVDVDALRAALASAEGRDGLAAFVLLRAAMAADDVRPEKQLAPTADAVTRQAGGTNVGRRARLALAASIAACAVAGSFYAGVTFRAPLTTLTLVAPPAATAPQSPISTPTARPEMDAASRIAPGIPARSTFANTRASGTRRSARPTDDPPKPTRVLRFVPGVDWRSALE